MKITVLGAGAIGSLFGGYLARHHEVTLVCREGHAQAVKKNGLKITGLSDITVHPMAVTNVDGLEPPDILFLTVKAYDTEKALADVMKIMSSQTILVSLQNGLGNMEIIAEKLPEARLVYGITSQGAILRSPGHVEHTGKSYTTVGDFTDGFDAARIYDLLESSGIDTDVSKDVRTEIWYKAIVNSVINPIGTLMKARNGIVSDARFEKLARQIVSEGVAVANARGIHLDEETAIKKVMKVARETANNICSMRLDVERGRRTEIMQMNGAIVGYGGEKGIPTPMNSLLTVLIRSFKGPN
ncbi:MAG: 2-dehydropantoate 2-reductase [Candidatus Thermoplasmatota archaeon]|nr:2-dehydropantoate 2-reductase [Euryarchaeota archaeon]MBU4071158.1 2-dehydropantoate 2-reductase [Candidatus Thermoplasmatota archaeon]MBU4144347.1 2-dehydropantoate 2-reductase [Candidatus Thermoplasmatota archaeon]MBU4591943.1 2-dehydropantoate 2-reductase [Candidatus Thermoplasmatota archaeon]